MSAGRLPVMSRPLNVMRPRGRREEVRQQVEAGGLAGAVGADERVDGGAPHLEVDVPDRDEAAELLRQPPGLQDDVGSCAGLAHDVGGLFEVRRGRGENIGSPLSRQARLASAASHDSMQSCWAAITSSMLARGSRWNDSCSSRLMCALAVGAWWRSRSSRRSHGGVDLGGRTHPVHEPHGAGLRRCHVLVEQRQLLGPAQADDASQAQHRAVGDDAVTGGAEAEHGVVGGQPHVAGQAELQAAADRVAVQHGQGDLGHVLQPVERPDPVAVERLADRPRGHGGAVHARAEGPPGAPQDDGAHLGVGAAVSACSARVAASSVSSALRTAGRSSVIHATPSATR